MPLPAIVPALGPALIGGIASAFGQHKANTTNVKLARERMGFEHDEATRQMEFQERMSSTAYQRAMQDMRTAGLNPMLAYMQGGASSPGGAAGQGAQATVESALGAGVSTALETKSLQESLKLVREQTRQARAGADKTEYDAAEQKARLAALGVTLRPGGGLHIDAEAPLWQMIQSEAGTAVANRRLMELQIPERKALARIFEQGGEGAKLFQLLMPLLIAGARK